MLCWENCYLASKKEKNGSEKHCGTQNEKKKSNELRNKLTEKSVLFYPNYEK